MSITTTIVCIVGILAATVIALAVISVMGDRKNDK